MEDQRGAICSHQGKKQSRCELVFLQRGQRRDIFLQCWGNDEQCSSHPEIFGFTCIHLSFPFPFICPFQFAQAPKCCGYRHFEPDRVGYWISQPPGLVRTGLICKPLPCRQFVQDSEAAMTVALCIPIFVMKKVERFDQ